jgi:hypothetical protein
MKALYYLVLFTLLLASCSASPTARQVQSTAVSSQTSSTSVPLSDVNLDDILLNPGDLPPEYIGQQISHNPPAIFESVQEVVQVVQQPFEVGKYPSDGITIFLFSSPTDLDSAYKRVTEIISIGALEPLSEVGEKAVIQEEGQGVFLVTSVQVVFIRCHALVYIQLFASDATTDLATSYAKKVDKRISPLVCD